MGIWVCHLLNRNEKQQPSMNYGKNSQVQSIVYIPGILFVSMGIVSYSDVQVLKDKSYN